MLRVVLSMVIWVTIARWLYAEINLSFPGVVPYIDSTLEFVQIPTHDRWPRERFQDALGNLIVQVKSDLSESKQAAAKESKPEV